MFIFEFSACGAGLPGPEKSKRPILAISSFKKGKNFKENFPEYIK
jgi:hypothetical protein